MASEPITDWQAQTQELVELMQEHRLQSATLTRNGRSVTFRHRSKATNVVVAAPSESVETDDFEVAEPVAAAPVVPAGVPVSSPMNGIYYGAPSPGSKPFVTEGEVITAGQVVGLIEAMKVFNEIPSPVSGTVLKINVESGAVVQPGEPLLFVG
jgi:acetyl-CoA carboxylase biotin carboxyl carrier protein